MEIELKGRFIIPQRMIPVLITDLRTTTGLGGGKGPSVHFFVFIPNPLEYTDPDGKKVIFEPDPSDNQVTDSDMRRVEELAQIVENSNTDAGEMYKALKDSDKLIIIRVKHSGDSAAFPGDDANPTTKEKLVSAFIGGNATIYFNPNDYEEDSTFAHEVGHAYAMVKGFNQWTRRGRKTYAMAVQNQYNVLRQNPLPQNDKYIGTSLDGKNAPLEFKNMPRYDIQRGYYRNGIFGDRSYRLKK